MKIECVTGLIDANSARYCPSPNYNQRPENVSLNLIVIHFISLPPGQFGGEWIDRLFTNTLPRDADPFFAEIAHLRVSSHVLIRRDGEIVQYVPFHERAWHAGMSCFQGRGACNDFSIGIELEGTEHDSFTDAQYEQLIALIQSLQQTYPKLPAAAITGHEHIAPGRKIDPGPYFDWQRLGQALGQKLPAQP